MTRAVGRWIMKRLGCLVSFRMHRVAERSLEKSAWPEIELLEIAKTEFSLSHATYCRLVDKLMLSEMERDRNMAFKYHKEAMKTIYNSTFGSETHYDVEEYTRSLNQIILKLQKDTNLVLV